MGQTELIYLDADDKAEIGRIITEPSSHSTVPAVGDFATIGDVGSPGKTACVRVLRRHFVYIEPDTNSRHFVQLWCERQR